MKGTYSSGEGLPFDLQSLVDSHEEPFVVIDGRFRIVAVNSAYERRYGAGGPEILGWPCHLVGHKNDDPCSTYGEECPHERLFADGTQHSCVHLHYDRDREMHQVRVTAYPLRASDGTLYMGELIRDIAGPVGASPSGARMVGGTRKFLSCVEHLSTVAASEAPVLLQGETGTGKELAAEFIHRNSPRRDKPFHTLDCTVLSEPLFEAEMFGHARGAFTGSVGEKQGLFEQAHGGTLFVDEIGELPLSLQAKLLRVLETGEYRRVGGRERRTADVRIVCATNRHLWDAVNEGSFREDLYYRIACLSVRLPALRERLDDVPALAECLLEPVSQTMKRQFTLTSDALERLKGYDYPGNVRELRNILFVAATHARGNEIQADAVDAVISGHRSASAAHPAPGGAATAGRRSRADGPEGPSRGAGGRDRGASLQDVEAGHIAGLLREHDGNRRRVAQALGVSERTVYRKMKKYGLR
ncbi:MAG: sigma 54-interacting transcriptional regulator [Chromatiales bacterium]|jgi:transcriptional regulator with PAS, ATPase and Fis domain